MQLLTTGAAALGVHLSSSQLDQFHRYYKEMLHWNSRVNLTSIIDWEGVQTRHFLDSLTIILAMPPKLLESCQFADIGSGAGFPGMPLKMVLPGSKAVLIEARGRKTSFLRHLRDTLGMSDVGVCTGRAEDLAHNIKLRESFDLVVTRAVASMAVLAELTLPFCRVGGRVIAQKKLGVKVREEIRQAQRAIETMGGTFIETREVAVKELGEPRGLVVLEKINSTPEHYPRRPGIPAKRPLITQE